LQIFNVVTKKESSFSQLLGSAPHPFFGYLLRMRPIALARKKVVINIWPSRHDINHVLIVTIDRDGGDERMIRTSFSLIVEKSQSARSVTALSLSCKSKIYKYPDR
jgi:hypothetical protein